MRKMLIQTATAAVILAGCAAPLHTSSVSGVSPAETSAEPETENIVYHGDCTLTLPEGWTAETKDVDVIPVSDVYKGHVIVMRNDDGRILTLSSSDGGGNGGDWVAESSIPEMKIGDRTYEVIYNEYPYSFAASHDIEDGPSVCYRLSSPQYLQREMCFNLYGSDPKDYDDPDVLSIISSLQVTERGKLLVTANGVNTWYGCGEDSMVEGSALADGMQTDPSGFSYTVFETVEKSDGTWYRVGDWTWIRASEQEAVYTPDGK